MKTTDFASSLSDFLVNYLPNQRGLRANSIASYRDTFVLFLTFCETVKNTSAEKITLSKINRELVVEFLDWLEDTRKNSVSTRNQRLAAFHALFRRIQYRHPEQLSLCQDVLSISLKRCPKPEVMYLTKEQVEKMLLKPDRNTSKGRRDHLLLTVLYDTGARVSELIDVTVGDVSLGAYPSIKLTGKGNKVRRVPLMPNTVVLLSTYLRESRLDSAEKHALSLFRNPKGGPFTRPGITYILQKYAPQDLKKITPHVLRHTKAMHLLQAGIALPIIRDILGHVDISTTEIYARVDTEMKRAALLKAQPQRQENARSSWNEDPNLMSWLKSL